MGLFVAQLVASFLITSGITPMKEVHYRGGLATFLIPTTWAAEQDKDSGGTFYLDEPDSGTLRLTIQTYERSDSDHNLTSTQALSRNCTKVQLLPNGNAICEYVKRADEDGEKITLYWWQVANVVPPSHIRIASFSYTILSSQEGSDRIASELKILRSSIEAMRFSKNSGL